MCPSSSCKQQVPQGSASAARAVGASAPQPPEKLNPTHDHSNRPYPRSQPTQQPPRIVFTQLIAANNQPLPRTRVRRDALQLGNAKPTRCTGHTTQLPKVRGANKLIRRVPDAQLQASRVKMQQPARRDQVSVFIHGVQQHKREHGPQCRGGPDPSRNRLQDHPGQRCMYQRVDYEQRTRRRDAQREALKPSHGSLQSGAARLRPQADCGR